jgi:ArsR family transcriptional regulator, arsenate/arsenite/antimonite-responsive transcriptional repressor
MSRSDFLRLGALDESNSVDIFCDTMDTASKNAVDVFHALSDETRLEILERLRGGEKCVCELTDVLKAAQSRLSFHLKVLKDAGLIRDRPEGRWMYYALHSEGLEEAAEMLHGLKKAAKASRSSNGCC